MGSKVKFGKKATGDFPGGRMAASLLRHPGVMGPLLGVPALVVFGQREGWMLPLVVAGALAVVLVAWGLKSPASLRNVVGYRVKGWSRRWFRYAPRWWFWMGRLGLSVTDEMTGWILRPRILKVRSTGCIDSLLLDLPLGVRADQVVEAIEDLRHAAKARRVSVRETEPGRVWVDFYTADPLRKTVALFPHPTRLRVQDLDNLILGYCEDGTPWRVKVVGRHIFVCGVTGAGKSSILWALLWALAPYIHAGLVVVHGIDPKGGMELEWGKELFERYECDDYDAMAELLEADADYLDDRTKLLRGKARTFTASRETPFVLIVIDELMQLTVLLPGTEGRRISARIDVALGRLLGKGRAPGYSVFATSLLVTKDVVTWRELFPTKIAMRLDNEAQVEMSLGEGARDRGAECDRIPESMPGVAYVLQEGRKEPVRVRASYVDDDQIRHMATTFGTHTAIHADAVTVPLINPNTVTGDLVEEGEAA
ncbi:FtsK/SpoIIIE domain-containing protein [Kribbella italica]|uniref:S-DNA-T family DNA segregation ATPase FtsK/SpoIIIE n=1 Tax=Kribbella italica TaxID=1540520 RepID=A0A7W9J1Y3_9ACTN|nr:FtsK/SpoIIIE domain-containing protein [Kribbella italica]MBB5833547.1 S-DNA-T family DNA segregation ATPase FtsK/SpoIIIE [Kribbella italica]